MKLLDTLPGGLALECSGAEAFSQLYTRLAEVPFVPAAEPLDRLPFPYRTIQEARMIVVVTSRPSGALLAQLNAMQQPAAVRYAFCRRRRLMRCRRPTISRVCSRC